MTARRSHSDPMCLELKLAEAVGTLHLATDRKPGDAEDLLFRGCVYFDVTERWHISVLRVNVDAWLDMRAGKLRYRLCVGGLAGWMSFRMRIAGIGPDYLGVLGPNSELQVAGWRNKVREGDAPCLTLLIYSSALGSAHLERLFARSLGLRG